MTADPGFSKGDQFRFFSLDGEDYGRIITIHSITVTGNLSIVIQIEGEEGHDSSGLHSCPLPTAERLVQLGIWKRLEADGE